MEVEQPQLLEQLFILVKKNSHFDAEMKNNCQLEMILMKERTGVLEATCCIGRERNSGTVSGTFFFLLLQINDLECAF